MSKWRIGLRFLVAFLALCVVAGKAGVELGLLPQHKTLEASVLIVGGLLVFVDSVSAAVGGLLRRADAKTNARVEKTVLGSLRAIATTTKIDLALLGGSVYIAKRHHWWSQTLMLKRIVRVRIADVPQPSAVKWTPGKGVIGQALAGKKIVHKDWLAVAKKYGDAALSQEQFDGMRAEVTSGFTLDEFRAIAGKYAEILAIPIWDGEKCIGILAIDVPTIVEHPQLGRCLNSQAIKEVASSCAAVLSDVVG